MNCPNCKSDKSAYLTITSIDGWSSLTHQLTGRVNLKVCMDCGVLYVDEYSLKNINEAERRRR